MPFKEYRDGKTYYTCDKCGLIFQFGQHRYEGHSGPNDTMLCKLCAPNPFKVEPTQAELAAIKAFLNK